jgi:hypothetical protein
MRCSNCGKDIPFTGKVCPWCHTDKSGDQRTQVFGMLFGMAGGILGWAIHGIGVALIGLFVGIIVGIITANKIDNANS